MRTGVWDGRVFLVLVASGGVKNIVVFFDCHFPDL